MGDSKDWGGSLPILLFEGENYKYYVQIKKKQCKCISKLIYNLCVQTCTIKTMYKRNQNTDWDIINVAHGEKVACTKEWENWMVTSAENPVCTNCSWVLLHECFLTNLLGWISAIA